MSQVPCEVVAGFRNFSWQRSHNNARVLVAAANSHRVPVVGVTTLLDHDELFANMWLPNCPVYMTNSCFNNQRRRQCVNRMQSMRYESGLLVTVVQSLPFSCEDTQSPGQVLTLLEDRAMSSQFARRSIDDHTRMPSCSTYYIICNLYVYALVHAELLLNDRLYSTYMCIILHAIYMYTHFYIHAAIRIYTNYSTYYITVNLEIFVVKIFSQSFEIFSTTND